MVYYARWICPLFTYISCKLYLYALPVRVLQMFLQICLVAQCDMAVAESAGPNAARITPKVHHK